VADQLVTLRAISWRDCCPWLIIARAFRLAISLQLLTFATLGVLLAGFGWLVLGELLVTGMERNGTVAPNTISFHSTKDYLPRGSIPPPPAICTPHSAWRALADGPVYGVWGRLNAPYGFLLAAGSIGWRGTVYALGGAFWTLAVWSWFGAAISRSAALQLTVDERPLLSHLFSHCAAKFASHLMAPILPLLLVTGLTIVLFATIGVLAQWDASLWIAGILWGPALVLAFTMAVVLLGLSVGWPLMWATISSEGTDAFDALSRSYSYPFQRPLHYLFYTLVAAVVGALGWFLVYHVADWVIHLCSWGASWTAGWSRIAEITQPTGEGSASPAAGRAGTLLVACWIGLVRTIATAFTYSFFWTSTTAIYLLLRYDVDRTEMDEVHLTPQDETYGLPPLSTDEAGVPRVAGEEEKNDV